MPIAALHPRGKRGRDARNERGVILIYAALVITVMLGFAGFAVDLGNWYIKVQRLQRAVDSAALAGAPYLPGNPTAAATAAREELQKNNVPASFVTSATIQQVTGNPAQLYVSTKTQATNSFMPLLGMQTVSTFTRAATATFTPPIEMANFSNVLGNEPGSDKWQNPSLVSQGIQSQYWLNIGGQGTGKVRGDRYNPDRCEGSSGITDTDGCVSNVNKEKVPDDPSTPWLETGYQYLVTAPPGLTGSTIAIEAYDPAQVATGSQCNEFNLAGVYAATGNDPRYQPTNTTGWCAGDGDFDDTPSQPAPQTTFEVWNVQTSAKVCTKSFGGFSNADLTTHLSNPNFLAWFHQWVRLCNVPYDPTATNRYMVRVTTDDGDGPNHFSLRVGLFSGAARQVNDSYKLKISGNDRLSIVANFHAANTRTVLAMVPQNYAGQDLVIDLFDVGDSTDPGVFRLVAGGRRADGSSATRSCSYVKPDTPRDAVHQLPMLSNAVTLTNCTLNGVWSGNGYDSKVVPIIWHVPSDYTCNPASTSLTNNCYLRLNVQYPGSPWVDDATTWTLQAPGSPLHLLRNPASP